MTEVVYLFRLFSTCSKTYIQEPEELLNQISIKNHYVAGIDRANLYSEADYTKFVEICQNEFGDNAKYREGLPPGFLPKETFSSYESLGGATTVIERKPFTEEQYNDFIEDIYLLRIKEAE
jgi:hypothetical protein